MPEIIKCRAKLEDTDCYDGDPITRQIPHDPESDEPEPTMKDDGTFDGETIVCDGCYERLQPFSRSGALLNEEIMEALGHYQANLSWVINHENPALLIEEATTNAARAREGSPMWSSANACRAMAEREVERRGTAVT